MKRKSIFLIGAMMLILGGGINSTSKSVLGASVETLKNVSISSECTHEKLKYNYAGLTHSIECEYCGEDFGNETHIDENFDELCDFCNVKIVATAPSSATGYVDESLTLNESIKISIKAERSEVNGITVSAWYGTETFERLEEGIDASGEKYLKGTTYSRKAEYNEETGYFEVDVCFADIDGRNGKYYFDALIFGNTGTQRYIRLSSVEYTKNGISTVSTNRNPNGTLEVFVKAVEGGEIYISTNGEEPTEDSNWITYDEDEIYKIQDESENIKEIGVYYRSVGATVATLSAPTLLAARASDNPSAMITEWTTKDANTTIVLPIRGAGINVNINWGDGSTVQTTSEFPSHTYSEAGTYEVKITGTCPIFGYTEIDTISETSQYYTYSKFLTSVKQLGELSATRYGFSYCSSLTSFVGEATENTFKNVTDMSNMFYECGILRNVDVSSFNTSNVTNMSRMFNCCFALKKIDLSSFNTEKVKNMENMFYICSYLEEINMESFNTSNVTDFSSMFSYCSKIKKIDISNFDISNAVNLSNMFYRCTSLEILKTPNSLTKSNCDFSRMFKYCSKLKEIDLSFIDSSKATSIDSLLSEAEALKTIVVTNKFIPESKDVFSNALNINAIIITSETPTKEQFLKVKDAISNVTFYVPNTNAEALYEASWIEDYTKNRIEPILSLKDNTSLTIGTYEEYDKDDYLVAGIDVANSGRYKSLGYSVEHNSTVNESTPGTYEHEYILKRTVNNVESNIMSVSKNIIVEKKPIKAPSNFDATQNEYKYVIDLTWDKHKDPNAKYELSYKDNNDTWHILSDDANTPYAHSKLKESVTYEYRLRAYDNDGYSPYTYTQGSTTPAVISGDTVLDTVKPKINFISYDPVTDYLSAGKKFEILFSVLDRNYYSDYNMVSVSNIKLMIGDETFSGDYIKVEKEKIENGEKVKIVIEKMPRKDIKGYIKLVIPEDTIKDKALNGNIEMEYEIPVWYVNSVITTDPPIVETEYNKATLTCMQETNVRPEEKVIYYEYRKSGDIDFIRTTNNIIGNLQGNTYYEFRTSLIDITRNEAASETVIKFIESITPELNIKVESPLPGSYPMNTEIIINAEFNRPLTMVDMPKLTIKFGQGENIVLSGDYDTAQNIVRYKYTIGNDYGLLTGVGFVGKIRDLNSNLIEYDFVPSFTNTPIFARTGAQKIDTANNIKYYSYIQEAIDEANNNLEEETIIQLLDEENETAIVVNENKNIFLDQNGKNIISRSGEYIAIENRGTLRIKEDIGTGKVWTEGIENAIAIVNSGTLTIENAYIKANTKNENGSAVAISNTGKVILGINDKIVKEHAPIVDSTEYGILNTESATFEFYDGVLMGVRGKSYLGKITTCDGYNIVTENIETAREKTYLGVDRIPPKIEYEILTPGWRKDYVRIKIKVSDEESGINHVTLNNQELELEVDFTKEVQFEENGKYVVYAEDNVGNSSFEIIEITTIDKEAPNILSITAEEEISETEVKVLITARDYMSGLAGIIMKTVDETPTEDEEWITFNKYPTSKQIISTTINRGETYYCFAKDRVGNISRYEGDIVFEYIDKIAPVIQSAKIIKENGKDYVIGKAVLVDVIATDNIGVTDILITDNNMSDTEVKESEDWKEYTRYNIYKLPVEGDKTYTIYIWVKDAAGNISLHATASVELKALIIGDNEKDYIGKDHIYNKSSLRFRLKDWNYDFGVDNALKKEDVLLRITSGDKVIRNVQTGLTLTKIKDYISTDAQNLQYKGEIFELGMENIPSTGNLSIVILGGAVSDLARNAIDGIVKLTDIFIDNNEPKIKIVNTETYDEEMKQIRNIIITDGENNLIEAIEVYYKGVTKTYALTNGRITKGFYDGEIIIAYDKAGNTLEYKIGSSVEPMLSASKNEVSLVYGGEAEKIQYVYNGDGTIYIESSNTNIANVSIDINTKEITILPVNAGNCEITVRTLGTNNFMESKMKIQVTVNKRPVILKWTNGSFDYDGKEKKVEATVENVILGDSVPISEYKGNIKINSGKYKAEALGVDNNNYTIEGGTNVAFEWEINKINRELNIDKDYISIRMPNTGKISFTYTGEEAKGVTATINGEKLVEPIINEAHGSGEINLIPSTVGHSTTLILTIPESTNYNEASANITVRVTKLLTVNFDAQGGTPAWHTRTVEYDEPYGELPVSTNEPREFIGWFTEKEGNGTLIKEDTIVTIKDKHTLYACWNRAPENVKVSVKSKTTNSILLTMSADDKDGDDLTFDVYLNGNYSGVTSKVAQGTSVEYEITGLSEYTYYSFYVIASDGMQKTQSSTVRVRTYCPGNHLTCKATIICSGTHIEYRDCGGCGGTGTVYCAGGSEGTCNACNGSGSGWCTGGTKGGTCSKCNGSGKCPGTPIKDGEPYTGTCHAGTHAGATYQDWKCPICPTTGVGIDCIVSGCPQAYYSTDNHSEAECPTCGGAGKTSDNPCSHNRTEGHSVENGCTTCNGNKVKTYPCTHNSYSPHNPTCGTCNGNKTIPTAVTPCEAHNIYHVHYHCEHITDGDSSEHTYCIHNYVKMHD